MSVAEAPPTLIRNRKCAAQIRDFRGLRFGNITPTDIDGFMDFGNRLFVLIESKYRDTEMPYGQRLALARLCDAVAEPTMCVAMIISHTSPPEQDIDLSLATVTEYRWHKYWRKPERLWTCRAFIEAMIKKYAPDMAKDDGPRLVRETIMAAEAAL